MRVACETLATTNRIVLAGEVSQRDLLSAEERRDVVRRVIRETGYDPAQLNWETLEVLDFLNKQSEEIAKEVKDSDGAGDQGLMFGYAVDETPALMPAPIYYCHAVLRAIDEARKNGEASDIGPDGKIQLSVLYHDKRPQSIKTVVLSHQHEEDVDQKRVREILVPIVHTALGNHASWLPSEDEWLVNPSGSFINGGPAADAGLTGRKIIVDTYGGSAPHGGGAFSGKDATKVDRSAAYAARYLAKNVVKAGLANSCKIQISYAIGVARPVSFLVDTDGSAAKGVTDEAIVRALRDALKVDLTPKGIRERFALRNPIYEPTAAYGHFGREVDGDFFTWEKTDLADQLSSLFG